MTPPQGPSPETAQQMPAPLDAVAARALGAVPSFASRVPLAYQTVAWRAPAVTRFDGRPANDFLDRAEAIAPLRSLAVVRPAPPTRDAGWITFAIGGCVAALIGALIGGMMSV